MISSIISSAMGLFAAVTAVYLLTWYGTNDRAASQTVAFFAWLVGHVLLAYNMRSERQPVLQMGLASNRMMLVWAAAVAGFLVLASVIPGARQLMKVTALTVPQWGMILGAALAGTFWIEVCKLITFKEPAPLNR
jgi:Ca2+-transporting ATPase